MKFTPEEQKRIEELERMKKEIEAELKSIQGSKKGFCWEQYRDYDGYWKGIYHFVEAPLRSLVCSTVNIEITDCKTHKYMRGMPLKVRDMTPKQVRFCNRFLDELAPIIKKYVTEAIEANCYRLEEQGQAISE